jgi:putative transposase
MYLTETHIINGNPELDLITFKCKNLYNKANYLIRQEFINNNKYISLYDMFTLLKYDNDYTAMPSRVSRKVLTYLDQNWKSFFATIKDWFKNKSKYKGKPNLPQYLPKTGKFNACFIDSGILKRNKEGIGLSSLSIRIKTDKQNIKEVNIQPLKTGKYKINIIYKHEEKPLKLNNNKYCSIDLGLNNLMTLTSNETNPVLVNGRPLKSINQYFNKLKAKYQSELPKNVYSSKKITKLTEKRNNKINNYLHESSKWLINYCISNDLNTIIIGYNEGWKQEIKLGKRNNQNFVGIPYQRLIDMIWYKATLEGINVKYQEEAYTSKCSSLDIEDIKRQEHYKGQRICRGLFKTSTGKIINADVNGSLNILRKAIPNVNFINGIEAVAVLPKRINSFKSLNTYKYV